MPHRTLPVATGPETTGHVATGPETTGLVATGPETTGPETTGREHIGPEPTGPAPDGDEHTPHAWIAPLVATVLTLPLAFVAFIGVALSPMACDPCSGPRSAEFSADFVPAFWTFLVGLVLPLGLLVTSWALPRRRRHTARRLTTAALAPLSVVLLYLLFLGLVDWP
ncbi:hypothetical protein ACFQ9H_04365 [Streptomyces sp. NPDC056517]|uniref:hypothetical protein n=1 Tax=Streptomyces sp. NPDC056517 TaxID=3345848 RepID=UPI0036BB1DEF